MKLKYSPKQILVFVAIACGVGFAFNIFDLTTSDFIRAVADESWVQAIIILLVSLIISLVGATYFYRKYMRDDYDDKKGMKP